MNAYLLVLLAIYEQNIDYRIFHCEDRRSSWKNQRAWRNSVMFLVLWMRMGLNFLLSLRKETGVLCPVKILGNLSPKVSQPHPKEPYAVPVHLP